jgi:hypothetical protein
VGKNADHCDVCPFCSKGEVEVAKIVQGPGAAAICNECIRLAVDIVSADDSRPVDDRRACVAVFEDGTEMETCHGVHELVGMLNAADGGLLVITDLYGNAFGLRARHVASVRPAPS